MSGCQDPDNNDGPSRHPSPGYTVDLPFRPAINIPGRPRADSLRSGMSSISSAPPHVPQNTPVTQPSVGPGTASNNDRIPEPQGLREHLERAQENNPGRFWEQDTTVPDNTPATGSPTSHYRPQVINLPRIDESLEQLPPPAASLYSSTPTSTSDSQPLAERHGQVGGVPLPPSLHTNEGMSTPATPEKVRGGVGVREHADWHDDVESDMSRGLARLANLAEDDHSNDPSKTADEYYRLRLSLLLNERTFEYAFGKGRAPLNAAAAELAIANMNMSLSATDRVTGNQFRQLVAKVDGISERLSKLAETQDAQRDETKRILEEMKRQSNDIDDLKRRVSDYCDNTLPRNDSTATIIQHGGENEA